MLCDTKLFTSHAIFSGGYLLNDSFSFFFRESRQLHNQCIDFPEAGGNSDCELIRAAQTLWHQAELWCSYADLLIVSRTLFFVVIFSSWQAHRCGAFIRITCIQLQYVHTLIHTSIKRFFFMYTVWHVYDMHIYVCSTIILCIIVCVSVPVWLCVTYSLWVLLLTVSNVSVNFKTSCLLTYLVVEPCIFVTYRYCSEALSCLFNNFN